VLQADKDHLPGAFNAGVDAAEARLRARVAAQEQQQQQERRDPAPGRRQQTAVGSQRAITNFLANLKKAKENLKKNKIRSTFLLLQIYATKFATFLSN
jgi:hypothetical protein